MSDDGTDEDSDDGNVCALSDFLTKQENKTNSEEDDDSFGSVAAKATRQTETYQREKTVTFAAVADENASASTAGDSELIQSLKQRKVLHYKPSLELTPTAREEHYSEIAVNYLNFKVNRTLKKCSDTICSVELLQHRGANLLNSS